MSQNEPTWQFFLYDKDVQVLSDQNDGTRNKISPNWTKVNEEANKVNSKIERIEDFLMVKVKKKNAKKTQ